MSWSRFGVSLVARRSPRSRARSRARRHAVPPARRAPAVGPARARARERVPGPRLAGAARRAAARRRAARSLRAARERARDAIARYTLVVPDGYAPQAPYPLVFVLHGGGGTAAGARTQTDLEKVAGGHAIFVYPRRSAATGTSTHRRRATVTSRSSTPSSLIAHNALCIDARRVFVTGFSNGAYMANQLACRRGERIRGIVTHAGGGPYETSGTYDATGHLVCPGKAVASLVVHGNSDGTVAAVRGPEEHRPLELREPLQRRHDEHARRRRASRSRDAFSPSGSAASRASATASGVRPARSRGRSSTR